MRGGGEERENRLLLQCTEDMELDDAIHTAILTLKEGYLISILPLLLCYFANITTDKTLGLPACSYEGQISSNNIEIGIIRSDREFRYVTPRFGPWFLTLVSRRFVSP